MTDLFEPPSEIEITKRKESRQKNCKHNWVLGAHGGVVAYYDGNKVYVGKALITEEYDICSNCSLRQKIRKAEYIKPVCSSKKRRRKAK